MRISNSLMHCTKGKLLPFIALVGLKHLLIQSHGSFYFLTKAKLNLVHMAGQAPWSCFKSSGRGIPTTDFSCKTRLFMHLCNLH